MKYWCACGLSCCQSCPTLLWSHGPPGSTVHGIPHAVTSWTAAQQASLCFTISWSLLKLMAIESVMLSNHLVLCCPLLLFAVYANYVNLFVYYSTGLEVGLLTHRDGTGREEGGGFRMGNTCIPVADSCWCMAKPIPYCKVKK